VGNAWLIVTVRKVGVLLLAILTVTADHTNRNLQEAPGMTCERSTSYSVLAISPSQRRSLKDRFLMQMVHRQPLQPPPFVIQAAIRCAGIYSLLFGCRQ
jgi:hypothetical protein